MLPDDGWEWPGHREDEEEPGIYYNNYHKEESCHM